MQAKLQRVTQRLIWIVLFATISFFLIRVYYRVTDDFRIANMTYEMPYNSEWVIPTLSSEKQQELRGILSQPFSYVGKGAQSYAFISEDKEHVIKFFKFKHLKPNWLVQALPNWPYLREIRENKTYKKKRQLDSVFSGYKLAYDVHREEAGLVYIHLNKTEDFDQTLTLIDKIGRKHLLDLDPIVFVVQKTAKTTRNMMSDALERGDVSLAKLRVEQIFQLYLQEYNKGIYDRDHGVMHNTGFVGENPIHLDVGKLSKEPAMRELEVFKDDLIKVASKYEVWMKDYYPQYYGEVVSYIEERLSSIFRERFTFAGS